MPPQIGRVISKHVYDGKLHSNPLHPVKDKVAACYFLDAIGGKEMQMESKSFRVSNLSITSESLNSIFSE